MKHSIPHKLPHALARRATQAALESYRQRFPEYQPSGSWPNENRADIRFVVMGQTLSGAVDVLADRIDLELEVPFMFRPFKSKALEVIEAEIKTWIDKASRGEIP